MRRNRSIDRVFTVDEVFYQYRRDFGIEPPLNVRDLGPAVPPVPVPYRHGTRNTRETQNGTQYGASPTPPTPPGIRTVSDREINRELQKIELSNQFFSAFKDSLVVDWLVLEGILAISSAIFGGLLAASHSLEKSFIINADKLL